MNVKFYMPEFDSEQKFCDYFFGQKQICDKYRNAKGELEFKSADEFDEFMDELGFDKVNVNGYVLKQNEVDI